MSSSSTLWYKYLEKSKLTPPDWVFSVVWPLLYASIIVYYVLMILNTSCFNFQCTPLILFTIQMCLNVLWPIVFFTYQKPKPAFIIILLMIGLTYATIYYSSLIRPNYTYILIPYAVWITFASYLNGYIVIYNNQDFSTI